MQLQDPTENVRKNWTLMKHRKSRLLYSISYLCRLRHFFFFHLYILFYDSKILHNSSLIFQLGVNLVIIFVILKPRLNQMYDIAHHIPSRLLARHVATISSSPCSVYAQLCRLEPWEWDFSKRRHMYDRTEVLKELNRQCPSHYLTILYQLYCLTTVNYIPWFPCLLYLLIVTVIKHGPNYEKHSFTGMS
jgi:hypothetical protein